MRKQKVAPLPIIDLGGSLKVIDDSVSPPRWKKIADCFPASKEKAKRVMVEHGLSGAWLFDDCGYKEYVTMSTPSR